MPAVQPEILPWARDTAGLSIEQAALRLGIKDARGVTAADRLVAIESGEAPVSRSLLLKMAKLYHRPLLTFYMQAPPLKGDRGEDFRSLPERSSAAEPLVDALLRDVRARQNMVRSILKDDEDVAPLTFVGSMKIEAGVGAVLAAIRRTVGLDLVKYRAQASWEGAFALLRNRIESAGVFVLLIGDLGSHHTSIDVSAFRGFALADPIAPFIVINDQDAKSAWTFTLLHELAHLWPGSSGVSGMFGETRIEQFCSDVASTFLLPGNELALIGIGPRTSAAQTASLITQFAQDRLLSRSMVAYRLFREGVLNEQSWRALTQEFRTAWLQSRAARRARDQQTDGGPNYYVVRRHRIGPALLNFVARSMSDGVLTPTKASKVLGVKPRSIAPLLSGVVSIGQVV